MHNLNKKILELLNHEKQNNANRSYHSKTFQSAEHQEKNHKALNTAEELEVFKRDAIENKAKHFWSCSNTDLTYKISKK